MAVITRHYEEPKSSQSPEEVAWAAGIYEGEGTVSRGSAVSVTQKDPWLLYQLQILYGGNVSQYDKRSGAYRWILYGKSARYFLNSVWHWLSPRRRDQAQFVLDKKYRSYTRK